MYNVERQALNHTVWIIEAKFVKELHIIIVGYVNQIYIFQARFVGKPLIINWFRF